MNFIKNLWRDLVEKRLLPVAVILAAALVAIPVLLGGGSSDAVKPSVTPSGGTGTPAGAVAQVSLDTATSSKATDRAGTVRNPFKPLHVVPPAPTAGAVTPATTGTGGTTPGATGTSGKTPTTTGPTTTSPSSTQPHLTLFDWTVRVRLGSHTAMKNHNVRGVTLLPSSKYTLLTYLGLKSDHKTAAFQVALGTAVKGGKCLPSAAACSVLELAPGESALLIRRAGAIHFKRYRVRVLSVKLHRISETKAGAKAAKNSSSLDLSPLVAISG